MAVVTGTNWNAYDAATMTSREIYGRTLAELGKHNEKIVGLTADLAKTTAIVHFAKAFPDRFYNVASPSRTCSASPRAWPRRG